MEVVIARAAAAEQEAASLREAEKALAESKTRQGESATPLSEAEQKVESLEAQLAQQVQLIGKSGWPGRSRGGGQPFWGFSMVEL